MFTFSFFRRRHDLPPANLCGHKVKGVRTQGEKVKGKDRLVFVTTPDYCDHCLKQMTISCAWCDRDIAIGVKVDTPIRLYPPPVSLGVPRGATVLPEGLCSWPSYALIGCTHPDCTDEEGVYEEGWWVPQNEPEFSMLVLNRRLILTAPPRGGVRLKSNPSRVHAPLPHGAVPRARRLRKR